MELHLHRPIRKHLLSNTKQKKSGSSTQTCTGKNFKSSTQPWPSSSRTHPRSQNSGLSPFHQARPGTALVAPLPRAYHTAAEFQLQCQTHFDRLHTRPLAHNQKFLSRFRRHPQMKASSQVPSGFFQLGSPCQVTGIAMPSQFQSGFFDLGTFLSKLSKSILAVDRLTVAFLPRIDMPVNTGLVILHFSSSSQCEQLAKNKCFFSLVPFQAAFPFQNQYAFVKTAV